MSYKIGNNFSEKGTAMSWLKWIGAFMHVKYWNILLVIPFNAGQWLFFASIVEPGGPTLGAVGALTFAIGGSGLLVACFGIHKRSHEIFISSLGKWLKTRADWWKSRPGGRS